ncbi:MAG: hypothetical protein PHG68_03645, partial [Candidatus Omnitrophica bacterium]|nr:hypothetical protein [Candidatus Omnitrophota bacterium]
MLYKHNPLNGRTHTSVYDGEGVERWKKDSREILPRVYNEKGQEMTPDFLGLSAWRPKELNPPVAWDDFIQQESNKNEDFRKLFSQPSPAKTPFLFPTESPLANRIFYILSAIILGFIGLVLLVHLIRGIIERNRTRASASGVGVPPQVNSSNIRTAFTDDAATRTRLRSYFEEIYSDVRGAANERGADYGEMVDTVTETILNRIAERAHIDVGQAPVIESIAADDNYMKVRYPDKNHPYHLVPLRDYFRIYIFTWELGWLGSQSSLLKYLIAQAKKLEAQGRTNEIIPMVRATFKLLNSIYLYQAEAMKKRGLDEHMAIRDLDLRIIYTFALTGAFERPEYQNTFLAYLNPSGRTAANEPYYKMALKAFAADKEAFIEGLRVFITRESPGFFGNLYRFFMSSFAQGPTAVRGTIFWGVTKILWLLWNILQWKVWYLSMAPFIGKFIAVSALGFSGIPEISLTGLLLFLAFVPTVLFTILSYWGIPWLLGGLCSLVYSAANGISVIRSDEDLNGKMARLLIARYGTDPDRDILVGEYNDLMTSAFYHLGLSEEEYNAFGHINSLQDLAGKQLGTIQNEWIKERLKFWVNGYLCKNPLPLKAPPFERLKSRWFRLFWKGDPYYYDYKASQEDASKKEPSEGNYPNVFNLFWKIANAYPDEFDNLIALFARGVRIRASYTAEYDRLGEYADYVIDPENISSDPDAILIQLNPSELEELRKYRRADGKLYKLSASFAERPGNRYHAKIARKILTDFVNDREQSTWKTIAGGMNDRKAYERSLRRQHPEYDAERIRREVNKKFRYTVGIAGDSLEKKGKDINWHGINVTNSPSLLYYFKSTASRDYEDLIRRFEDDPNTFGITSQQAAQYASTLRNLGASRSLPDDFATDSVRKLFVDYVHKDMILAPLIQGKESKGCLDWIEAHQHLGFHYVVPPARRQSPLLYGHGSYKAQLIGVLFPRTAGTLSTFVDADSEINVEDSWKRLRCAERFDQDPTLGILNYRQYIFNRPNTQATMTFGSAIAGKWGPYLRWRSLFGGQGFYGHGADLDTEYLWFYDGAAPDFVAEDLQVYMGFLEHGIQAGQEERTRMGEGIEQSQGQYQKPTTYKWSQATNQIRLGDNYRMRNRLPNIPLNVKEDIRVGIGFYDFINYYATSAIMFYSAAALALGVAMHSVLPWYWAIGGVAFMMAINSFMLVQYWEQKGNNPKITGVSTAIALGLGIIAFKLGIVGWFGLIILGILGFLIGLRPIREWIKFLLPDLRIVGSIFGGIVGLSVGYLPLSTLTMILVLPVGLAAGALIGCAIGRLLSRRIRTNNGLGLWPSLIPSQADGPEVAEGGAAAYTTSLKGPARAGEKWLKLDIDKKGKLTFSGVYQRAKRGMEIAAFSIPLIIGGFLLMFILNPNGVMFYAIGFYLANLLYISTVVWAFWWTPFLANPTTTKGQKVADAFKAMLYAFTPFAVYFDKELENKAEIIKYHFTTTINKKIEDKLKIVKYFNKTEIMGANLTNIAFRAIVALALIAIASLLADSLVWKILAIIASIIFAALGNMETVQGWNHHLFGMLFHRPVKLMIRWIWAGKKTWNKAIPVINTSAPNQPQGNVSPFAPQAIVTSIRYSDLEGSFVDGLETRLDLTRENGMAFSAVGERSRELAAILNHSLDTLEDLIVTSNDAILREHLQELLSGIDNRGPPIRVRVSSALPTNSARYFNVATGNVEIIFNEGFIGALLNNYSAYPEATKVILAERLFHELGHSNAALDIKNEEARLIILDQILHQQVVHSGAQSVVNAFYQEVHPAYRSGYYFKFLDTLAQSGPKEASRQLSLLLERAFQQPSDLKFLPGSGVTEHRSASQLADSLRRINLGRYNSPYKFAIYSGPPGGGKGMVWKAFLPLYGDLISKFTLFHTRKIRPNEEQDREYHFRSAQHLEELRGRGLIITTLVNKQLQGLALKSFTDTYEDPTVEGHPLRTVEVRGLDEVFKGDKIVILEGGLGWFEELSNVYGRELTSIFISPFSDVQLPEDDMTAFSSLVGLDIAKRIHNRECEEADRIEQEATAAMAAGRTPDKLFYHPTSQREFEDRIQEAILQVRRRHEYGRVLVNSWIQDKVALQVQKSRLVEEFASYIFSRLMRKIEEAELIEPQAGLPINVTSMLSVEDRAGAVVDFYFNYANASEKQHILGILQHSMHISSPESNLFKAAQWALDEIERRGHLSTFAPRNLATLIRYADLEGHFLDEFECSLDLSRRTGKRFMS